MGARTKGTTMRMFEGAKGYKTAANAEAALVKALEPIGETLESVRWGINVSSTGRFVPVVYVGSRPDAGRFMYLIHTSNVCIA